MKADGIENKTATICRLNDEFRCSGIGRGTIIITRGVQEEGDAFIESAVSAVRAFDAFDEANDPWEEHDFGTVHLGAEKLFWKIDYYDLSLTVHSPDAANATVTHRVLTIMLASEY